MCKLKRRITIAAFGDSLTYGYGIEENKKWTTLLSKTLNCTVINSGICGNTSDDGLLRINKDILHYKPDYVLINFSMNDHMIINNGSEKVPLNQFEKNIRKIICLLKNINAVPILVTPHKIIEGSIGDGNMGGSADYYYSRHPYNLYKSIGGANIQLKRYCDKMVEIGKRKSVLVVDINKMSEHKDLFSLLINKENGGIDDGVHLNENGAKFYADTFINIFKEMLSNN